MAIQPVATVAAHRVSRSVSDSHAGNIERRYPATNSSGSRRPAVGSIIHDLATLVRRGVRYRAPNSRLIAHGASLFALAAAVPVRAQQATDAGSTPVGAGPASQSVTKPVKVSSDDIEDIIVTASRRGESIQKTPTSIAAFSGSALVQAQISNLDDLAPTTPNVQISTVNTSSNVAIRGIGNGQTTAGSDPGVAIHVDGVYLSQSSLVTSTFLDVDRVEVLRGPQGTLFGRNATGGAINIVPNLPTSDLHYGFDLSGGVDPGTLKAQGYLSGPLNGDGTLLGRVAVVENFGDGYARNLATDGPRRLDNQQTYGGRAQIQWRPSADFDVRASMEYQRERDNGGAFYLLGTPAAGLLPPQIAGASTGEPSAGTVRANVGDRRVDYLTATLVAKLALGNGDVRAVYSYNDVRQYTDSEDDGTDVPFASARYRQNSHQHFAELLYTSDADRPFDFIVGSNFYREELKQDVFVSVIFLPPGLGVNLIGAVPTSSYALFGHATYKAGSALRLFGGLRYSYDSKSIADSNNFVGTASGEKSWARLTYEAGVSADLSHDITAYAKFSTGYKSGGFSVGALAPAFNPETDRSVEAGIKGNYFDGRLKVNLTGFHMKYDDLQVNQIVGVSSAVTNAARATINGLELEIVARPVPAVRLELAGGLLDAKFDEFTTADSSRPTLGALNLAGNRLPLAPTLSGSAGAYYDRALRTGKITLGARIDYRSRVYFSEFNIPITSQGAIAKLDLRLSYSTAGDRWTAGVYARNVLDRRTLGQAYVVSAALGSLALGQYQPGRQIGVSLSRHF